MKKVIFGGFMLLTGGLGAAITIVTDIGITNTIEYARAIFITTAITGLVIGFFGLTVNDKVD